MRIYISSVQKDLELSNIITQKLMVANPQWKITSYDNQKVLGDDYRLTVSENIKNADIVIIIFTENYKNSRYGIMELDWALAYHYEHRLPRIIPVIFDDEVIPWDLASILCLSAPNRNDNEIIQKLIDTIKAIDISVNELRSKNLQDIIDDDGSKFIQETKKRLERQAKKNSILSYIAYSISFLLIILSVIFCTIKYTSILMITQNTIANVISIFMLNLLIISLLIAASRFSFILGKSFMVEAIRNLDRIHAIDFGDFYLKLFGKRFEWKELKETLQNWNIDKGSAFILQDSKDIDPSVLTAISDYIRKNNK